MKKQLMLGNEAVARGAYEAGCKVVSSYPGTPSTEITEFSAKYSEIKAEWAPNEKVAMEVALGAELAGGRAMTAMKHVGMNVAADPMFTAAYTGVNAGLVICVADDQGMHSSQNEQDSRHYARSAKLPMLEPSDSQECKDFVKKAFAFSEQFDTPFLLRLSTRVSHSQSLVSVEEREERDLRPYKKEIPKNVMMPAMAKGRHVVVEKRMEALAAFSDETDLNAIEYGDKKIGVIAAGIAYQYAKEALGDRASYLKLGMIYPLPERKIRDFAESVEILYVIEELDPVIEEQCRAMGLRVQGKELFSLLGEYTSSAIRKVILGEDGPKACVPDPSVEVPMRPPVMCAGCPHRGTFYTLKKLGLTVTGDIGCYTLGAAAPLSAVDSVVCMGAGVGMAFGMEKAGGDEFARKTVAVIGDSTFIHSGITGLIDIVYNKGTSTVLILDNSITGMTGHQDNPLSGKTITGEPTKQVDLLKLCDAIGVERVRVVNPFHLEELERVLKEEVAASEPSVVIVQSPCALLKYVKHPGPLKVNPDQCKSCKRCMAIACPAISMGDDKKAVIDFTQCTGCGLCQKLCPFNAIGKEDA